MAYWVGIAILVVLCVLGYEPLLGVVSGKHHSVKAKLALALAGLLLMVLAVVLIDVVGR